MTHLNAGDQAPEFQAAAEDGSTVQLSDYAGKKLVLFSIKDNTPGCTAVCDLRDNHSALLAQGYHLLGVSQILRKNIKIL